MLRVLRLLMVLAACAFSFAGSANGAHSSIKRNFERGSSDRPTEREIRNLTAMARLHGYIVYFSPSWFAWEVTWPNLLVHHIPQVRAATSDSALIEALMRAYRPLGPRLALTNHPGITLTARPGRALSDSVRQEHYGLASGRKHRYFRSSLSSEKTSLFPTRWTSTPRSLEKELVPGLWCAFPTVEEWELAYEYDDASHPPTKKWTKDSWKESATRIADVITAWNVYQHFYFSNPLSKDSSESLLRQALVSAAVARSREDQYRALRRMIAPFKDGACILQFKDLTFFNIKFALVEDRLVVSHADANSDIHVGDEVLTIDGKDWKQLFSEALLEMPSPRLETASLRALNLLRSNTYYDDLELELRRPGQEDIVEEELSLPKSEGSIAGDRDSVTEVAPGILYVPVDATDDAIMLSKTKLLEATGVIWDARKVSANLNIISVLLDTPVTTLQNCIPEVLLPDREAITHNCAQERILPSSFKLQAPSVFIVDAWTQRSAEVAAELVKHFKLATLVGERTAGIAGETNSYWLPSNMTLQWTGAVARNRDGTAFQGVGVTPNIEARPTLKGIRENRDEILERAIEILQAERSGDR